jgi:hypothetical protein
MVMVTVDAVLDEAPLQWSKVQAVAGVAVRVILSPDSYSPPEGETEPAAEGLILVVRVYICVVDLK